MSQETIQFETPYGPATVLYTLPRQWNSKTSPSVNQVAVQCPDHIVWDNTVGKWYPEPKVVDYVLPRARIVCQLIGIPEYEWLMELRRDDIWAIEKEYMPNRRIGHMMEHDSQQQSVQF